MVEKNRAHGKIDGLPPEIREGVEQQLMTGETYGASSDTAFFENNRSTICF